MFADDLRALEAHFDSADPVLEIARRETDGYCAFAVVWNLPHGARFGKGGTRIHPCLTLAEIRELARRMALKNAAAGLPIGGAKSGFRADPTDPRLAAHYRRFVREMRPFLAEFGGPFGGFGLDVGADPSHADWVRAELGSDRSFTGKSIERGGTDYDNEGIAGLGVAVAAHARVGLAGASCAVQGVGAMGAAVVRYASELGARLVCVSDPRLGGTHQVDDTQRARVVAAIARRDLAAARALLGAPIDTDPNVALYAPVDVLFPCALQDAITEANMTRIAARAVIEGANGPCTPAAQAYFHAQRRAHVPDIIANPGGIVAAYVELTATDEERAQNGATRVLVTRAMAETRTRIAANVGAMRRVAERHRVSEAQAGRYIALTRMAHGLESGF